MAEKEKEGRDRENAQESYTNSVVGGANAEKRRSPLFPRIASCRGLTETPLRMAFPISSRRSPNLFLLDPAYREKHTQIGKERDLEETCKDRKTRLDKRV